MLVKVPIQPKHTPQGVPDLDVEVVRAVELILVALINAKLVHLHWPRPRAGRPLLE